MQINYFEAISEYMGIISWFVVLIAAKLSHISTRKKMTRQQVVMNIIYGIVGGIMAYFGAASLKYNFRIISAGIGVLAGDVIVGYIIDNASPMMTAVGKNITRYIKRDGK